MDIKNASENGNSHKFTMSDDDSEFEEVDIGKHAKFLESIGVDLKEDEAEKDAVPRTEPSKDVSLFTLSQIGEGDYQKKIFLHQLMNNMKDSSKANVLRKQVNKLQKSSNLLNAPLSKPVAERLERKVEYEKSSTIVGKWDPIVQKHRKAEHMSFPLKQEHLRIKTVDQSFNVGSKMTPLEEEISALLSGNKCNERPDHELSVMEEEALAAMSLEEAQARLVELRKHRALLSYQQAKNKRQHKIKSKSYHRILRKKKMKEEGKKEADEGDYNRADRLRAEERASLRHRMGSKWAKSRSLMAKHDESTKFELQEQQRKHEELVEKHIESDDEEKCSNDEEGERKMNECLTNDGLTTELVKGNPWLSQTQLVDRKTTDASSNKKAANENLTDNTSDNKNLKTWLNDQSYSPEQNETTVIPVATEAIEKFKSAFSQVKNLKVKKGNNHKVKQDLENLKDEDEDGLHEVNADQVNVDEQINYIDRSSKVSSIDNNHTPDEISAVKVKAGFVFKDTSETVSQDLPKFVDNNDGEEFHEMTIEQAFADDDVLAEFQTEKDEIVDDFNKIEEVDLKLPGWGNWGGSGVVARKKKKTFSRKPLPSPKPRRDQDLGHVILNENRDVHIAKHQVNQVPFPFVNKAQFERSVARPIGGTWNTPETVSTLVKPKVSTVMGAIISPIDEDDVVGTVKPNLKRKASKAAQKKRGLKIVQSRIQDRKSKLDKLLLSVS